MELKIVCPYCKGTGLDVRNTDPQVQYTCHYCNGEGSSAVALIGTELDSIIAEQASQRIDLTAALTQIWNKVKDL